MARFLKRAATVLKQKSPRRWMGNWIQARWAELRKTERTGIFGRS